MTYCTGKLTVNPKDSKRTTNFVSSFGKYTISGTYDAEDKLTVADDGGLGGFLKLEPILTVAGPVIQVFRVSNFMALLAGRAYH